MAGGHYGTIAELVAAIKEMDDTMVVATDPHAATSMWVLGNQDVAPLSESEIKALQNGLSGRDCSEVDKTSGDNVP